MNPKLELQAICKIKELRTSNMVFNDQNERTINELNELLSKGWVLLRMYTSITAEPIDDERKITAEVLNYVLGFPHNGVSYVADQHREEFDL